MSDQDLPKDTTVYRVDLDKLGDIPFASVLKFARKFVWATIIVISPLAALYWLIVMLIHTR